MGVFATVPGHFYDELLLICEGWVFGKNGMDGGVTDMCLGCRWQF